MSETSNRNGHYRRRAQSVFEYRPRVGSELTVPLLGKLISSATPDVPATVASAADACEIVIRGVQGTLIYVCEPLVAGLLIFPLLILFWQAGWNLMLELLNTKTGQHPASLVVLYFLAQLIFLFIYMQQDKLYDFLRKQKSCFIRRPILQLNTLLTATNYIVQWVSMWTLWDRYTSADWLLMLIVSIAALLAVIALTGHPCDLVCAPFLLSYDSIEYNVRIGTPFVTEKMSQRLSHFVNYIFYEYIMSNLSILAWRGSYTLLDVFLYPKNAPLSAGLSLLIGYPLYFILMYGQAYLDKAHLLPTFVDSNYPLLSHNIRHLGAFISSILLWRGFWLLFDTHLATISIAQASPYFFYLGCMLISFLSLTLIKTASSINGPMSHMPDELNLFPLYPNSYLEKWLNDNKKCETNSSSSSFSSSSTASSAVEPFTITLF